jgi:predicted nucleic acid-binding protein
MIILDTNVISELMHAVPDPKVVAWIDRQAGDSIWISSITIFEVTFGLEIMTAGSKQGSLRRSFVELRSKLRDRIAFFDERAAEKTAELMATRQRSSTPRDLRDSMIAGIVLARRATIATRNVTHFADISANIVDPWVL